MASPPHQRLFGGRLILGAGVGKRKVAAKQGGGVRILAAEAPTRDGPRILAVGAIGFRQAPICQNC